MPGDEVERRPVNGIGMLGTKTFPRPAMVVVHQRPRLLSTRKSSAFWSKSDLPLRPRRNARQKPGGDVNFWRSGRRMQVPRRSRPREQTDLVRGRDPRRPGPAPANRHTPGNDRGRNRRRCPQCHPHQFAPGAVAGVVDNEPSDDTRNDDTQALSCPRTCSPYCPVIKAAISAFGI